MVEGRFDPDIDGEALRRINVNRTIIAQMTEKEIPADEKQDMIIFDDAKTNRPFQNVLKRSAVKMRWMILRPNTRNQLAKSLNR